NLNTKRAKNRLLYDNFRYEVRPVPLNAARRCKGDDAGEDCRSGCKKRVALIEIFAGSESVIGCLEGWRGAALEELDRYFLDKDGRERGFRLFLALKSLRTVDARRGPELFDVLRRLTLEETIFWVWQYHSYGERAIGAMKHIHMNMHTRARPHTRLRMHEPERAQSAPQRTETKA
ncbi:MAG: hypothetical protein ACQXXL_08465, partial [Candidatus Methanosuratincola sp.]